MANSKDLLPHGTPEMTPSCKFKMINIMFLANLQFVFQGYQK